MLFDSVGNNHINIHHQSISISVDYCDIMHLHNDEYQYQSVTEKVNLSATSGIMKCWPERWSVKAINTIQLLNLCSSTQEEKKNVMMMMTIKRTIIIKTKTAAAAASCCIRCTSIKLELLSIQCYVTVKYTNSTLQHAFYRFTSRPTNGMPLEGLVNAKLLDIYSTMLMHWRQYCMA